ncbi:MAG: transglutaminase-like domain-containing protein [Candidatus Njordarchaeia archaeon]
MTNGLDDEKLSEAYKFLHVHLPEDVERLELLGYYEEASDLIARLLGKKLSESMKMRLIYEIERIRRIKKDYRLSKSEALEKLRKELGLEPMEEKLEKWERKGYIDFIFLNGEKRYFNLFFYNLLFLCSDKICRKKALELEEETWSKNSRATLQSHIENVLKNEEEGFTNWRTVRAGIKVTIKTDNLDDEFIKCWLPFPKPGLQTRNVKLLKAYPSNYVIAPEDVDQRTIYFETKPDKEGETYCLVEFQYDIAAFHRIINEEKIQPYNEEESVYRKYTGEKPPHIVFTRYLKNLAHEIVGDEENPYLKAKKIYDWLTENLTYTYTREYSTYECIPEFVARNLRGDCGFQALLFITLTRIVGVPSRWQSGWYANPTLDSPGPHDWAQFYVEPYGWLFADLSFGRRWRRIDRKIHEFYFGNIDGFRTVFNWDIQGEFYPKKKFLRSDPVDNQRGEVETDERNLYFDEFETEIYYVNP